MRLNVVTLCSGYDSQCLALSRLKRLFPGRFDYELIAWAEVDRYAIEAHDVLFPGSKGRNMGDITRCDWGKITERVDLMVYSTPCTSISFAGKMDGLKKGSGTASSVIWSVLRAIDKLRPKYLLMENVKALVSSKFIGDFHEWQMELEKRGYTNFAKILNARDYGVPQNRERIFMVSVLDDNASYHFPEPFPLDKRLKDVLEEDVDEKYYLSKKTIDMFMERNRVAEEKGNGFRFFTRTGEDIAAVVKTRAGSQVEDNYIKEPISCAMRGREVYGSKHTITSVQKDNLIVEPFNPCEDGACRTLKAQYYKNGMANFKRTDGLGATGVKVISNIYVNNVQGGRIYDDKGISPTIGANTGGNLQPKILSYTREANGKVVDRHLKDVANTIHGATDGGGNTDSFVVEPSIVIGSTQKNAYVGSVEGISPCINAACGMGGGQTPIVADAQMYRIRKLTPREVFRLMDVDDEDIDKLLASGISNTQLYKMAGNSIVVNCLYHIFRKMFIEKENESNQLTLF